MAVSLKAVAASCLGVSPPFTVNRDVYGYIFRDGNDLFGGNRRSRSLLDQIRLMRDRSINLSLILVGHEDDFSGVVTMAQVQNLQEGIQGMRDIYAQAPLGIRKLYWQKITPGAAGGYAVISDSSEATDLTDDWNGPNDGIDVFMVQSIGDADGWSDVDGPCGKDDKDERTGAVCELGYWIEDILLAHEVGHYLGLTHTSTITNVMGSDADGDGIGAIDNTSLNLTSGQGSTMRGHCTVRGPC